MSRHNRQWKLVARPVGEAKRQDFDFVTVEQPEPAAGQALVEVAYISIDPAMRGWMNDSKSYLPPVKLGEVMRAAGVGRVLASNDPKLAPGDWVHGMTGVQSLALGDAARWEKVDVALAPPERWLGVLGSAGVTAYFGLFDVGKPQPGETVVVSGAAGAVGALVGQLAKLHGCRVIGIAGGPDKCRYLVETLRFDGAVDYKKDDVYKALKAQTQGGIDVYFDNVGGELLDIALAQLKLHARVVLCGAISQYNATQPPPGPRNYLSLLINRARMEGFVVVDYLQRAAEAIRPLAAWLAEGKLVAREDVAEGLERFPEVLGRLFRGENFGKLVLKV